MLVQPEGTHLAQLNVARARFELDDARMVDFVGALDRVNAIAESSPGFVWRLQGDVGNATDVKVTDNPRFIVNLSVRASIDDLHAFTYRSEHKAVFARRYEWFERADGPNMVLWWVPAGTLPDAAEALDRLRRLAESGPTPDAFSFKQRFPPPDGVSPDLVPTSACPWRSRPWRGVLHV